MNDGRRRTPTVLNHHRGPIPPAAVPIDRSGRWGNRVATHLPYAVRDGILLVPTRDEAVARWWKHHRRDPEFPARVRRDLAGRDLVCWCAPARCHGHPLLDVANTPPNLLQAALDRWDAWAAAILATQESLF